MHYLDHEIFSKKLHADDSRCKSHSLIWKMQVNLLAWVSYFLNFFSILYTNNKGLNNPIFPFPSKRSNICFHVLFLSQNNRLIGSYLSSFS